MAPRSGCPDSHILLAGYEFLPPGFAGCHGRSRFFRGLGDRTRLQILKPLYEHEWTVGKLVMAMGQPRPLVARTSPASATAASWRRDLLASPFRLQPGAGCPGRDSGRGGGRPEADRPAACDLHPDHTRMGLINQW